MDGFFRKKITGRKQGKNRAAREGTSKSRALWRGVLAFAPRGDAERAPTAFASGCGPGGSRSFPVFSLLFGFCRNYLSPWSFSLMTIRAQSSPCFFWKISVFLGPLNSVTGQLADSIADSDGRRTRVPREGGAPTAQSRRNARNLAASARRPLGVIVGLAGIAGPLVWPVCETDAMVSGMAEIDTKLYQCAQVERRLTELGYRLVEDSARRATGSAVTMSGNRRGNGRQQFVHCVPVIVELDRRTN